MKLFLSIASLVLLGSSRVAHAAKPEMFEYCVLDKRGDVVIGASIKKMSGNACDALGYGENCFDAVVCSSIGINRQYACNFCESGHCKANPDNDKKVMCEKSDGTEQEEEKTRGKKWFKAKGLKFQGLRERNNKVPRTSHLRTGGN